MRCPTLTRPCLPLATSLVIPTLLMLRKYIQISPLVAIDIYHYTLPRGSADRCPHRCLDPSISALSRKRKENEKKPQSKMPPSPNQIYANMTMKDEKDQVLWHDQKRANRTKFKDSNPRPTFFVSHPNIGAGLQHLMSRQALSQPIRLMHITDAMRRENPTGRRERGKKESAPSCIF